MDLSPLEYDLRELREVAGTPDEDADAARHRADGGTAVASDAMPWLNDRPRGPRGQGPTGPVPSSAERAPTDTGGVPDHLRAAPATAANGHARDAVSQDESRSSLGESRSRGEPRRNTVQSRGTDFTFASVPGAGPQERPYLRALPGGVETELLVLEWLEGLVARAGVDGARDALEYYRAVDWLAEEAASELEAYVDGMPDPGSDHRGLTTDDHRTSLQFVVHLAARQRQ